MSSITSRAVGIAALCLGLSACGESGSPNLQPNVSGTDKAFTTGATQSSDSEIAAAGIALTKTKNPDVIGFANEMITQHNQEKAALAPIASTVGVALPDNVNPMQAATAATLQATPEPAFDALYINSEITGHTLNLDNNFTPETTSGQNPSIVGYAKTYKPQIAMHLQMAQAIKAKYGF